MPTADLEAQHTVNSNPLLKKPDYLFGSVVLDFILPAAVEDLNVTNTSRIINSTTIFGSTALRRILYCSSLDSRILIGICSLYTALFGYMFFRYMRGHGFSLDKSENDPGVSKEAQLRCLKENMARWVEFQYGKDPVDTSAKAVQQKELEDLGTELGHYFRDPALTPEFSVRKSFLHLILGFFACLNGAVFMYSAFDFLDASDGLFIRLPMATFLFAYSIWPVFLLRHNLERLGRSLRISRQVKAIRGCCLKLEEVDAAKRELIWWYCNLSSRLDQIQDREAIYECMLEALGYTVKV